MAGISYSSLTEAFGDDFTGKKKKKVKQPIEDPICSLYESPNSTSYTETDLVNYSYDKSRNQRTYSDKPTQQTVSIGPTQNTYESTNLPNSLFASQFDIKHPNDFEMDNPRDYMVKSCRVNDETESYPNEEIIEKPRRTVSDESRRASCRNEEEAPVVRTRETYYSDESETEPEYIPRKVKQERRKIYYDESDVEDEYVPRPKKKKGSLVYLDIILYILSGIILIFLLESFVKLGINMQHV